jgi:hypothetical protein
MELARFIANDTQHSFLPVAGPNSTQFLDTPNPRRVYTADLLSALSNARVNRFSIEQYGLKGSSDNFRFLREVQQFISVSTHLGMRFSPCATSVDDFCAPLANVDNDRALNGI